MRRAALPVAALVGLAAAWALAQAGPLPPRADAARLAFVTLGVAEGLPVEAVSAVVQDARGFVWAGTSGGLVRLDGTEPLRFGSRADDPSMLPSPVVQALAADDAGGVWVGTAAGLAWMDPAREEAVRVEGLPAPSVLALGATAGGVWVGTSAGAARVEAAGSAPRAVRTVASRELPHPEVQAVLADADGVWLGTGGGLVRLDDGAGPRRVALPGDAGASVSALAPTHSGALLVGTLGRGAFRLDPRSGAATALPLGTDPATTFVQALVEDSDGGVWAATLGGGLVHLVPAVDGYALRATYTPADGLADLQVTALFGDRQGVLWAGTVGGLGRTDRARGRPLRLPVGDTRTVAADASGGLWMATAAGLLRSGDGGATSSRLPVEEAVTALAAVGDADMVAGTAGGRVGRVGLETGATPLAEVGAAVEAIAVESGEVFWVATRGRGLVRVDRAQSARVGGLPSDTVRALARDARGDLWAGTPAGLCRVRAAAAECLLGEPLRVHALASASDGALWAGTAAGLVEVAPDGRTARVVLGGTAVLGLAADRTGFLWLATRAGFVRFDPVTRTATPVAGAADAGPAGPLAWLPDGRLAAASLRGALLVDPRIVGSGNPYAPQATLTGVVVGTDDVRPGPESPLDVAAPVARELRLSHDQNAVTFRFAVLHFGDPERNSARVQLEGLDVEPRDVEGRREASYTNLAPGRYTFRVAGVSADGIVGPPAELAVIVRSPWWRTPWALLAGVALLGAVVVQADRMQRARILRQERERAARREAELRAEAAEAARREATAEAERRRAEADQQRAEAALLQADNDRKAAELDRTRRVDEANARLEAANRRLEESLESLHATQDQLVQQEKLASLGQLTAGIAHEIKNPLNFVNGFAGLSVDLAAELIAALGAAGARPVAEVLPEVQDLLDDLRDNAERIREHGQRTDAIVRSMLLLSRNEASERARLRANPFVDEHATLAYHGARAADPEAAVALTREFDPDAGWLDVAEQDVGRVLINLVGNAVQATAERRRAEPEHAPHVILRTRREGDVLAIDVEDNGPGIPEGIQEKIFEPFFTTKPAGKGTGLGLSLAADIVGLHGGTLTVESQVGAGATFTVRLPAAPPPPDAAT